MRFGLARVRISEGISEAGLARVRISEGVLY